MDRELVNEVSKGMSNLGSVEGCPICSNGEVRINTDCGGRAFIYCDNDCLETRWCDTSQEAVYLWNKMLEAALNRASKKVGK